MYNLEEMITMLTPVIYLIFVCLILGLLFVLCKSSRLEKFIFRLGLSLERGRSKMELGTVSVEEKTIAYLERKGQGETMVLVHGFGADKENWLRFVRHIPEIFRVVALDLPGHGESSLDFDEPYDAFSMERRLALALDEIFGGTAVERIHIAGNSMGGLVSLLYAQNHPDRVISLGLFDSAGIILPTKNDLFKALEKGENPLVVSSRKEYDELLDFSFETKPFFPWPAINVMARQHMANNEHYLKMWNDLFADLDDTPVRKALPNIKPPVLVLWGDKDRVLDIDCARVFVSLIPDATLEVIKDCGHVPMIEKPGLTAKVYIDFISSKLC